MINFEAEAVSEKITYGKTQGTGEDSISYHILNSKNKVIATCANSVLGENKTIVDDKNVLVNYTFRNGKDSVNTVSLKTDLNDNSNNLVNAVFDALKSGNNYKGSWLKEKADSTEKNETFALGTNKDTINYDLSKTHGKDTVTLVKGADLTLNFTNAIGTQKVYSKKGNDIIMELRTQDYTGSDYKKVILTAARHSAGWVDVDRDIYVWNEGQQDYVFSSHSWQDYTDAQFNTLQQTLGVTIDIGENMFFVEHYGEENAIWHEANASIGTVTFKNYIGLEENSVTIGDTSLKQIIEAKEGVGVLNYHNANKKQTVKGTFLNEKITGCTFNRKTK